MEKEEEKEAEKKEEEVKGGRRSGGGGRAGKGSQHHWNRMNYQKRKMGGGWRVRQSNRPSHANLDLIPIATCGN